MTLNIYSRAGLFILVNVLFFLLPEEQKMLAAILKFLGYVNTLIIGMVKWLTYDYNKFNSFEVPRKTWLIIISLNFHFALDNIAIFQITFNSSIIHLGGIHRCSPTRNPSKWLLSDALWEEGLEWKYPVDIYSFMQMPFVCNEISWPKARACSATNTNPVLYQEPPYDGQPHP